MQSVSQPLAVWHENASWFARAHDLRVLLVRVSGGLRSTLLKMFPMLEFHADNFSPWILFEDAHTEEDPGWQFRANRLVADWERRREAFGKDGVELPPVPAPDPTKTNGQPAKNLPGFNAALTAFHETVSDVLKALREPLRGLVLILAPSIVDSVDRLESDMERLLGSEALEGCRFVLLLDIDLAVPQRLLDLAGDQALACECVVDEKQQERDIEAIVQTTSGPMSGGASPLGVIPPARVDDPPTIPKEQLDAELRKAGINPESLELAPKLRGLLLGAALDMSRGRGADAIEKQTQARDLCEYLEMHETKVVCQIALASYLSGLERAGAAITELEEAVVYAAKHGLPGTESQAHLALGLHHAVAQRYAQAALEYTRAAQTAETAQVEPLAIEAWRMAGQVALEGAQDDDAATYFQHAIRIAQGGDPNLAKASSAAEAARRFAELCRRRNMPAQAESLYELADRMESGELAASPTADPQLEPVSP